METMSSLRIEGLTEGKSWNELVQIFTHGYNNATSCYEEIGELQAKERDGKTECSIEECVKSADYMADNGVEAMHASFHRLASLFLCGKNKECSDNPRYFFWNALDFEEYCEGYAEFKKHIPFDYIAESPDGIIYLGVGNNCDCDNALPTQTIDDDLLSVEQMRVLVDFFDDLAE